VPEKNVDCPCGEPFQTRDHILCCCVQYVSYRDELEELARVMPLSEILGTIRAIAVLAKFLRDSDTFTTTGEPRNPPTAPSYSDEKEINNSWSRYEGKEEE